MMKNDLRSTVQLRRRGSAFALLARLLGPDVSGLVDDEPLDTLRALLDATGDVAALDGLDALGEPAGVDAAELAGRWVRWFDLGRVAPYEGSNVPATAGGITARLADISGFYLAFGLAPDNDRPDHLGAELEFLSVLLLTEADARDAADSERAEVAADAARVFLRDHLGTWVTAWAARVAEVGELAPWAPLAAATDALVRAECHDRHVIPLRLSPVLPADTGLAATDEPLLECGDDSPFN